MNTTISLNLLMFSLLLLSMRTFGQSEAEILNIKGNDLGRQGKFDEAIIQYNKAIKIDPSYSEPYYNRGKAKLNLKSYLSAIQDFDIAAKLDPKNSDIFNNRGIAKKKLGDNNGAISDYTKSISLNPQNYRVYYNRGIARFDNGDSFGACSDFKMASSHNIYEAIDALNKIKCD